MYKVFASLLGRDEPVESSDVDTHWINQAALELHCELSGISQDQAWAAYDDLIQSGLAGYLWDQGHPRIVLTEAGEKLLPGMVEEVFGEVNL